MNNKTILVKTVLNLAFVSSEELWRSRRVLKPSEISIILQMILSLFQKTIIIANYYYYSFKIFPQFWLAKSTRIIHHNQLLMTKFGRILCLTRKWRQKCSLLQVNAPLTEKTWRRDWVVSVVKTKMADTSLVSRVRTTAGTRRNNGWKHSKNSKKTARRATSAVGEYLRGWTDLNVNYRR